MTDVIRTVIFRPYRKGMGPVFTLRMFGAGDRIAYTLRAEGKTIFEGSDFRCSPLDCEDSDESVKALMGFLTLRPGDTDREYFEDYTEDQLEFCSLHAETLSCEVGSRFGWE